MGQLNVLGIDSTGQLRRAQNGDSLNAEDGSDVSGGQSLFTSWVHATNGNADFSSIKAAVDDSTTPRSIIVSGVNGTPYTTATADSIDLDHSGLVLTGTGLPVIGPTGAGSSWTLMKLTRDTTRNETVGTVSTTKGSNVVTGVSTTFTNLSVGDWIFIGTNTGAATSGLNGYNKWYQITAITNDTSITVGGASFKFSNTWSTMSYTAGTVTRNIIIDGFIFENDGTVPGVNGISFTDCFDIIIRNCRFRGLTGDGIVSTSTTGLASNVIFENCSFDAISLQAIAFSQVNDFKVRSCTVDGALSATKQCTGICIDQAFRSIVENNQVQNCKGSGILLRGYRNKMERNSVWNCGDSANYKHGIVVDAGTAGNHQFTGNVLNTNDVRDCAGDGIHIQGVAQDIALTNNIVTGCDEAGIYLGASVINVSLTGNHCIDNTGDGIEVDGHASGWRDFNFTGNNCHHNGGNGITATTEAGVAMVGNVTNSNAGAGIDVSNSQYGSVVGNMCRQNTGTEIVSAGSSNMQIANNPTFE